MMATRAIRTLCAAMTMAVVGLATGAVEAANPPFTEDFAAGFANWADSAGAFGLDYVPAGGPDGNGYISDQFSFLALEDDETATVFRAHAAFGSSGGAFVGNWIADGVGEFKAMVRHDLPVPVSYFARFASPVNFPGAIAIQFAPVFPNTWTELSFEIDEASPQFVSFEGTDFASVFSSVGNVQVGVTVPTGFGMLPTDYTLDLDTATITVPEPALMTQLFLAGLVVLSARRRWPG